MLRSGILALMAAGSFLFFAEPMAHADRGETVQQETRGLGEGRFITTLRLPVMTDGASYRHCEPDGPCLRVMFRRLNRSVSIFQDAYVWHLKIDNPTNHPVSAKWRCARHEDHYKGPTVGAAEGSWGIYPPGFVADPRPGGMGCMYADPATRPQWIEVALEWTNYDAIGAARDVRQREEITRKADRAKENDRLQREFASKIKRTYEADQIFNIAPDFRVTVRRETATLTHVERSDFTTTVARIEFADDAGTVLYREDFSTAMQDWGDGTYGFREACITTAGERSLAAAKPRFIEMTFDCSPSAPGYTKVRWYGLDKDRRFRAVKSPLDGFRGSLTNVKDYPDLPSDRLYATVHTGYTNIIVPFKLNQEEFSLQPDFSQRFLITAGPGFLAPSPLRLTLRDQPAGKTIAIVTIGTATKSKFLRTFIENSAAKDLPSDWIDAAPWMEVEIDDKRGWVNLRDDPGLRQALHWSG